MSSFTAGVFISKHLTGSVPLSLCPSPSFLVLSVLLSPKQKANIFNLTTSSAGLFLS